MSSRVCALAGMCLVAVLTVGCGGEPPEKEIQQAQGALDAAAAAGAALYATDEFATAQQALGDAKTAVDQRDYRLALNHALDSRDRAQTAAKEAADGKATARSVAEHALGEADAALAGAQDKLKGAEEKKLPARLLVAPKNGINTASARLQEARAAFEQGRYKEVPAMATAATAMLTTPLAQIDQAAAPPVRRRR